MKVWFFVIFCLFRALAFSEVNFVTIGVRLNIGLLSGYVYSSTGEELRSGGVSVGFFTGTSPVWAEAPKDASIAWNWLRGNGYVDLRSFPNSILSQSPDYRFSSNPTDSPYPNRPVSAIDFWVAPLLSDLNPSTSLYVIAFNNGYWDSEYNYMETATFGGTEWAVLNKMNDINVNNNWLSPSVGGTLKMLYFNNLAREDVIIGDMSTNYANDKSLRLAAAPEPSSVSLLLFGGLVLMAGRRRKQSRADLLNQVTGQESSPRSFYDAKLLSEEGWKRIEEANSPKVLTP